MNSLTSLCVRHLRKHLKCLSLRYLSIDAQNKEFDLFERQFNEIDVNSFTDIIDNNQNRNLKNKIEMILNEYEYEKHSTLRVPSTLTSEQMKELLELPESLERLKFFRFLYSIEAKRMRRRLQKKIPKFVEKEVKPFGLWDQNNELMYGLRHNTMFQLIGKASANRQYIRRLRTAALFGPKLVIDLDFEKYVKKYEARRLLKQLAFLYNYNRYETIEPFDLHFVNCNKEDIIIEEMPRYLPKFNCSDFLVTMHYKKSYLDVFPKEKLVYLSPHSEETLTEVSDEDIYIIGGIIDKSYRVPITAIKAREDGIRSARLPIDSYLTWNKGSKNLCINQVLAILHDWKLSKDWEQTLRRHIPSRKIYTEEEIESINLCKTSKYI